MMLDLHMFDPLMNEVVNAGLQSEHYKINMWNKDKEKEPDDELYSLYFNFPLPLHSFNQFVSVSFLY